MKFIRLTLALLLFTTLAQAQNVKDFSLTSVTDKSTFTLSKSKGKYIALHFLLKTECPYCIRHTSEYFEKAKQFKFDLNGATLASDAFFPFDDCVRIAHAEGIEAYIQPGGSVRDKDSIAYCKEHGLAMVMTQLRHFKH